MNATDAALQIRAARRLIDRLDRVPMPPHLAETYALNRAKVIQADDVLARTELGFLPLIPLGIALAAGLAGAYGLFRVGKAVLNKVDEATDKIGTAAIDMARVLMWVLGGAGASLLIGKMKRKLA